MLIVTTRLQCDLCKRSFPKSDYKVAGFCPQAKRIDIIGCDRPEYKAHICFDCEQAVKTATHPCY